jgi:hypothetical protein
MDVLAAKVTLAAVGTGDLDYARHFADEQDIAFPLLVDEASLSYRAVGTKKGSLLGLANPKVLLSGAAAVRGGNRQGRPGRAPLVLGAAHVIRPDGSVPYAWVNEDVADNAPIADVLAAAR